eukprot:4251757-Lingulodinium_polyedra.AAC.1
MERQWPLPVPVMALHASSHQESRGPTAAIQVRSSSHGRCAQPVELSIAEAIDLGTKGRSRGKPL